MNNKIFGEKLRLARKAKGLTQQQVAEMADIDEKHLSRIENGKFFPTFNTLNRLLAALDLPLDSTGLEFQKLNSENPLYIKALQILNSAEDDMELGCYLEVLITTNSIINKVPLIHERLKGIFENEFLPFIKEKTNISFLDCDEAEADDLIARFIKLHNNDLNIILSTDNDFIQLLSDNVIIYNSMEDRIVSNKCMISSINNVPIKFSIKDGKISVSRTDCLFKKGETNLVPMENWVQYALFSKCIRGDKSDNIFSAYPGIREKSTKNTVGMLDAFADMSTKGYNWQTFMNSTWETPFGEKKIVKECYEFNKRIIDLNEIPDDIKNNIDKSIKESLKINGINQVGFNLAKFLNKWKLEKLLESIQNFSSYFSKTY